MEQKEKKKLALVGSGKDWVDTPFDDKEFDIWSAASMTIIKRVDLLFEPHETVMPEVLVYLKKCKKPVYMVKRFDDIPKSIEYPLQKMILIFGRHFACTISYMMALAITEGYKEIYFHGICLEHETEYSHQRASVDYFVGWARGKGIKVVVPANSDVGKTYLLYGYQTSSLVSKLNARMKFMGKDLKGLKQQQRETDYQVARHEGGLEMGRFIGLYLQQKL